MEEGFVLAHSLGLTQLVQDQHGGGTTNTGLALPGQSFIKKMFIGVSTSRSIRLKYFLNQGSHFQNDCTLCLQTNNLKTNQDKDQRFSYSVSITRKVVERDPWDSYVEFHSLAYLKHKQSPPCYKPIW